MVLQQKTRRPMALKFDELPDEALVPINVVMDVTGRRTTSVYDGVKSKTFPSPEKFGARCTRWRVGKLRRWLADPVGYFETK